MNAAKALGLLVALVSCISLVRHHLSAGEAAIIEPPAISDRDLPDMPGLPRPVSGKPRVASFYADSYGQFWIDGKANGVAFRFLADTGASDISFSKQDARRLGLDVARLSFDGLASTANGVTRTASARIARLQVGPFTMRNVSISINEGELDEPLLGMGFLRRLHVSIGNGLLTLSDGV
jgi:clan AA aspartic protease (TIGR02281 family)